MTVEDSFRKRTTKMILGFVLVLILQGVIFVYYISSVGPPPSPSVIDLQPDIVYLENSALCPNDIVTHDITLSVKSPTVIEADISIINEDTGGTVSGTEASVPSRPRDRAETLIVPVRWSVPDLPPGNYRRVTGISPKNRGGESSFVTVPFSIMTDCGE